MVGAGRSELVGGGRSSFERFNGVEADSSGSFLFGKYNALREKIQFLYVKT